MTSRDVEIVRALYDLKNLFADKWVLAIAVALREGPCRPVEILSTIDSYSIDENWAAKPAVLHDSILSRTLKKMREQGLVTRHTCTKSFPPESVYTLRPEIVEVLALMEPLIAWTREHGAVVEQAQASSHGHSDGPAVAEIATCDVESDDHLASDNSTEERCTADGHSSTGSLNGSPGGDVAARGEDGEIGGGGRGVRRHARVPGCPAAATWTSSADRSHLNAPGRRADDRGSSAAAAGPRVGRRGGGGGRS